MSTSMQQYLYDIEDEQPKQREPVHYDTEKDLLYITVGTSYAWYTVVGSPEHIRDWFRELGAGVADHVTQAIAARETATTLAEAYA